MSQNTPPISAYAAHKRKTEKLQHVSKRMKRQNVSQDVIASNQNLEVKKTGKQITSKKNQVNGKTFNVSGKMKKNITKKLSTTKSKKENKKNYSDTTQLKNVNTTQLKNTNATQLKNNDTIQLKNTNATQLKNTSTTQLKNIKKQQITDSSYMLNAEKNSENEISHLFNPTKDCMNIFEWLICPVELQDFHTNNFEKRPVHIQRNKPSYYLNLVSTSLLDETLREKKVFFTKNIDITSYTNGVRETHNPPGRAVASAVWDYYMNKCSVRMLNPQTFIREIYMLNATLQEYFGCFVGSNLYLTPPGSQGFAPHYDDIEAFVLQVEGKKRWRLYRPPDNSYLARYSSRNFDESEIGEPILDTILEAGDLLYFPRGTIHQAETADDAHSLHITLSVYQKNSWYDFFEKLLPLTLKRAAETNYNIRTGLPFDYLRYIGIAHTTNNDKARKNFEKRVKNFLRLLIDYIDIDNAADLMAKSHIHDFLPPALTLEEQKCSVAQDGDIMTNNGLVKHCMQIEPDTRVRLTRSHCMRLIKEDDGVYRIYYSTENSKEYHEYELQFLEVEEDFVAAIKEIIKSYPNFIRVGDLPIEYDDYKIQIVKDLWEKGLLITDIPRRDIASKKDKKDSMTKKKLLKRRIHPQYLYLFLMRLLISFRTYLRSKADPACLPCNHHFQQVCFHGSFINHSRSIMKELGILR